MWGKLPVSKQEAINIGLLTLLSVTTGIGSYFFRTILPSQTVSPGFEIFQYSVTHILLGLTPIMFIRARTIEGRVTSFYLFLGIGLGLLIVPFDLVLNMVLTMTIFLGGLVYFRFFKATNAWLLILVSLLILELYLYGVWTILSAVQETGRLRLGIAALLLTILLGAFGRMIMEEFNKSGGVRGKLPI